MTSRHNISHADMVFRGGAYHPGVFATNKLRGAPVGDLVQVELGSPVVGDADNIAAAQAVAGAGALTLTAAVFTMDVARNVTITSAGNDSGITFTVTGTDIHGLPVVEVITGANAGAANGKKAFKTVSSVVASGAAAGNVSVGFGDVLGLPYRLNRKADILAEFAGDTNELASSVVVVGDATAATGTTGDVRGTINPNATLDGSTAIIVWMRVNATSRETLGGVSQYAG